jgi:outer membrane protein assembly factor BamD (BamD/ComL family)
VETRIETRIVYMPQEVPVLAEEPPAPAPALAPAKVPVPARPKDDKHARDRQLAAERVLVEQARSALARGQPKAALEVLLRHQHDWPLGQLVEEREALWILALVADGRKDEARGRAELFRERYPKSILLRSINSALAP